jgi:hypothetical protein
VTDAPDGTRTIAGIVPSGAAGQPFPFAVNDGPRRDPDLYGSLTLRLAPTAGSVPMAPEPAPAPPAPAPALAASRTVSIGLSGVRVRYGTNPGARVTLACPPRRRCSRRRCV